MKQEFDRITGFVLISLGLLCLPGANVMAATSATSLSILATNLTSSIQSIATLVTAGSYISGICFALGAIMKFKQHKDNPTQILIGTPISLLLIGAALIFFPSVLKIAASGVFGTTTTSGASGTSTPI